MPKNAISLLCSDNSSLLNASFLTGKVTQVIQFSTANFTELVDFNAVDKRRIHRENTLHTDVVAHFAHCETLFLSFA